MNKKTIFVLLLPMVLYMGQSQAQCAADEHNPHAFDLCTVYEIARCHDSTLQAAKQAQLAVLETIPQASAAFLPVISAQANHNNAYNTGGVLAVDRATIQGKNGSFITNNYFLNLTQPILHFEHWQKYNQADDLVKQANATFASAEQDLMVRTSTAYFGVLQAIDQLYFATAQLKALKKFYEQTNERFKVGLIAITDVQIAKASHDSAVAQVINAQTAVANQLEKLREIVGYRVEHLLPLKETLTLPPPEPADTDQWVAAAIKQNFDLQAQRYKTLAAREDIRITEMGHLPTVDLLGRVQRNTPTNQVQFRGTTSQLTLQVNVPIFSGGSVLSKTRQARHTFLQRDKETETLFRTVESNTRQFYLNVITQISQVSAFKQAVISNQSALEATQASFNVGTRTIVDVLNAQTGLIQAQLNLAIARYAYILQSMQLKRAAGTLCPDDLCSLNAWLKSTPADEIIKKEGPTSYVIQETPTTPTPTTPATSETPATSTTPASTPDATQTATPYVTPADNVTPASATTAPVAPVSTTPIAPLTVPAATPPTVSTPAPVEIPNPGSTSTDITNNKIDNKSRKQDPVIGDGTDPSKNMPAPPPTTTAP